MQNRISVQFAAVKRLAFSGHEPEGFWRKIMTKEEMTQYAAEMQRNGSLSRDHAAEMLRAVLEYGEWEDFTKSVTCEQIGWALERICLNCGEVDPLSAIVLGYRARERERAHRVEFACRGLEP